MLRKFILMAAIVLMCGVARAEDLSITDTIKKLPGLKQGIGYSMIDNKINYLTTMEVLKWKDYAIEVGYAGDAENTGHKAVVVASAELVNLKKLGVTVPILDLLDFRVGVYGGVGQVNLGDNPAMRGNNEWDAGFSLTAITVKF